MKLKIAVLGGGGFIGSNLTRRLVDDGHDVTAVDLEFPAFRDALLEGATRRHLDMTSPIQADEAVYGQDVVFHFAAQMGGVGLFHGPADLGCALQNGVMTANVFNAVLALADKGEPAPRVFYSSSACCYPIEQQGPGQKPVLAEDQVGRGTPDALYGAEKLHGLRLAAKVPNARVGIFHTIYGPGQEHEGRSMKFPAAVATKAIAARDTGTLELWGDGSQSRSYLYIDDAIDMICAVAFASSYYGPVNIGARGAYTCIEVAKLALTIAGAGAAQITTNPAEPTGVWSRDCNLDRFENIYGPAPDRGITAGMRDFIAWLDGLETP